MRRMLPLLLVVFLFSCSSKPTEPEQKNTLILTANDFMKQGSKQFGDGLFSVSITSFNKALGIYSGLDDQAGSTSALLAIGKTHLALNDMEEARNLFTYTVNFTRMTGDLKLYRSALNSLAEYHIKAGEFDEALSVCEPALTARLEELNAETAVMYRLRGTVYKRQNELVKAEKQLLKALQINEAIMNHADAASDYYLLASVYSVEGDFVKALEMAEKALVKDRFAESMLGVASDLQALGRINEKAGNTDTALFYYHRAYLAWKGLERYEEMDRISEVILGLSDGKQIYLP